MGEMYGGLVSPDDGPCESFLLLALHGHRAIFSKKRMRDPLCRDVTQRFDQSKPFNREKTNITMTLERIAFVILPAQAA